MPFPEEWRYHSWKTVLVSPLYRVERDICPHRLGKPYSFPPFIPPSEPVERRKNTAPEKSRKGKVESGQVFDWPEIKDLTEEIGYGKSFFPSNVRIETRIISVELARDILVHREKTEPFLSSPAYFYPFLLLFLWCLKTLNILLDTLFR